MFNTIKYSNNIIKRVGGKIFFQKYLNLVIWAGFTLVITVCKKAIIDAG